MTVCEIKDLCKSYPSFSLKNVSFTLERGTVTGFIGRNGAGKSTTIKAMLDFVRPDGGEVLFFGKPYAGNENEIRNRTGYAAGTVNYYPKKKLKDILACAASFYGGWDENACREYLSLFGLDENKTPSEMSEGMKVKCNLALALSHGAELLILDEPTSGLDPFARDELTDILTELKNRGVTVFFSTHITSDLEKCADHIIYIRNGGIVAAGTKADFLARFASKGEDLEETFLRLEREARHEKTV